MRSVSGGLVAAVCLNLGVRAVVLLGCEMAIFLKKSYRQGKSC